MKSQKMKFVVVALIAMMITLFTQESLAYYTTTGIATNVVTSGNIEFVIHETTDQGTPFPTEGVYVVPGDVVSKQVFIENVCEHPFYLRVKMVYGVDSAELSAEDCFKLNIDTEHWKLVDGWYYYQGIVEPGAVTPYVFSKVEIVGNKVDNSYIGKTLSLSVVAHVVQSEHNLVDNDDPSTAKGWPKE